MHKKSFVHNSLDDFSVLTIHVVVLPLSIPNNFRECLLNYCIVYIINDNSSGI